MTRIKLCGLMDASDIECANTLMPDYIGFVFYSKSRRYVEKEAAAELKKNLKDGIKAVGVFVDEKPETAAGYAEEGVIDIIQLHGHEDSAYIEEIRKLTDKPVIQAFRIDSADSLKAVVKSTADHILLDSGAGTGETFDWSLLKMTDRPYFLAGGLTPENVREAVRSLDPFAVDVSSGIETDGKKDHEKMKAFTEAVRSKA